MLPGHTIGIDLGTTYSSVGVFLNGKVEIIPSVNGKTRIPSYVAFTDSGRLFGDKAKEQLLTNPTNTIYDGLRLIDRQFKELIFLADMKRWDFKVINHEDKPKVEIQWKGETRTFAPEEIIAMTLGHLKETAEKYLGGTVTNAVVSLPSSFTFSQRRAITDAGQIACLNILRFLNSSTATALAFGVQKMPPGELGERNILVFDVGGGTTNVSVATIEDGITDVKSTGGDSHLGGEDFDERIVRHFASEFKRRFNRDLSLDPLAVHRLRNACVKAKHALSDDSETRIKIDSLFDGIDFESTLTRSRFDELCADLFRNTMDPVEKAIRDAKMDKSQIHDIVLVGGSTRIPKIKQRLSDLFNGKPFDTTMDQEESAVYGVAIQAAITGRHRELENLILLDVLPHSLGIETPGGVMTKMLQKNTTIPTKVSQRVTLLNQNPIKIKVFEGERAMTKDNRFLAEFDIEAEDQDIQQGEEDVNVRRQEIEVLFDIDERGILNVTATNVTFRAKAEITVNKQMKRLSTEDLEDMTNEAKRFKLEDKERERLNFKTSVVNFANLTKLNLNDPRLNVVTSDLKKQIADKCDEVLGNRVPLHCDLFSGLRGCQVSSGADHEDP